MMFFTRTAAKDKPYKDILLHGEDLLSHAKEIARANADQGFNHPKRSLMPRVKQNMKFLEQAYREIAEYSSRTQDMVPATEWLMDNFYRLKDLRTEILNSLPEKFELQLPQSSSRDFQGYPRIYGLLIELIEHTDSQLKSDTLKGFINAYQLQIPLSSGELWAIPVMLRIILLENIRRLTEQILFTQAEREAADRWVLPLLEMEHSPEEWEIRLKSLSPQEEYSSAYAEQILKRIRELGTDVIPLLQWVDRAVAKQDTTIEELAKSERQRQTMCQVSMGHAITSIHFVNAEDWPRFFEEVSLVESVLENDPGNVYKTMDFQSRDYYRHCVEKIARSFKVSELAVARKVMARAQRARERGDLAAAHVGYDLMGAGREDLEAELEQDFGRQPSFWGKIRRVIRKEPNLYYFGSVFIGTGVLFALALSYALTGISLSIGYSLLLSISLLIWAGSMAIPFVNWLASELFRPSFLPKLELEAGIPQELRTMVVIPTLLTNVDRVSELINDIEVYYLANREENLHFALLGDFADAKTESVQEDKEIIAAASEAIKRLNLKYEDNRFYFFHRRRLFNPAEGVWMGWERKRGKLLEFNRLLRQDRTTSYDVQIGDLSLLPTFRYVITLDADTQLPRGTAKKLIGTIAHPLHRPQLSEDETRIVKGYGILQPRVGVSILKANASVFARIFSGRVGVDPYTTAVSDVYQDMFGEGIFTGKGIYDVEMFHKVTAQSFPENRILSHDLIEGVYARAGLVSDIELVDGFPANYLAYMCRSHRWVRGDWQLLPWLLKPLPLLSRWKIFDNLRRSLEAPAQMLLFIFGFTVLAVEPLLWLGLMSLSLFFPVILYLLGQLFNEQAEKGTIMQDLKTLGLQFILQFLFLPYQAWMMLDAMVRSLYRQFISHELLLEWETASDAERRLDGSMKTMVSTMWPVPVIILLALFMISTFAPGNFGRFLPLGTAWLASLWAARYVSFPTSYQPVKLSSSEQAVVRRFSRRIWAFFEEYVGEEDNWLPPDNVQIDPPNGVAHRTSPTNIGLALLTNLAARDFGYLTAAEVLANLQHSLQTIQSLERWQGHLYNWYDTQNLTPLEPKYISTVDSGNFVMYLLTLKSGLAELLERPLLNREQALGLEDTYRLFRAELGSGNYQDLDDFAGALEEMLASAEAGNLLSWSKLLSVWPAGVFELELGQEGLYWARRLDSMVRSLRLEMEEFYPWVMEGEARALLTGRLSGELSLREVAQIYEDALGRSGLSEQTAAQIKRALQKIRGYIQQSLDLQQVLEEMAMATDFKPLYDESRQLFSIGYRVGEGKLDNSYYDLLASEARQASYFAIAKGDVPPSHWFKLGRALTLSRGQRSLVSWSGTMFEFLMPLLVMRNYQGTLLDETYRSVVEVQKKYGLQYNVPWGISESGFHAFDPQLNYQYKAFGVPGLGLKRGLIQDLVIAPYACFLALMVSPQDAVANLSAMEEKGFGGRYGLFEAIDFTAERIPVGRPCKLVQSFMAHHQGMSLLAMDNILFDNSMQNRLHNQALIQSAELLLQERIPEVSSIIPQPEDRQRVAKETGKDPDLGKNQYLLLNTADSPIPIVHCISNGQYSVMMTNSGSGFSRYREISLSRWREDVTQDAWGTYFYIQNLNSGDVWSAAYQPCRNSGENYKVTYAPDQVEFCRQDGNITTHTEIVVSPEDQAELRRISLTNQSKHERVLEVTSYFEVVLARQNEDLAHPAFGNLFIQTEFSHESLLASRRPRGDHQARLWLVHTLAVEGERVGSLQYETDRARFIGRGRSLSGPQALDANHPLSNTVGAVLDPIMSLRQRVRVRPGQTVRLSFATGYADGREEAVRIAEKYRDSMSANRAFELAWTHSKMELRHLNLSAAQANEALSLGGHLLFLSPCRRDAAQCIAQNSRGQSALWPYAISGDLPIVLVRVANSEHFDLVRRLLTIHEYWRMKGLLADLVILNEDDSGYRQAFQDSLRDFVSLGHARDLMNQPGGVFLLQKSHVQPEVLNLLCTVARMTFSGEGGSCTVQVRKKTKLAVQTPRPLRDELGKEAGESFKFPDLGADESPWRPSHFVNGYGGFSEDGKEYIIELQDGMNTPLPWINVIANPNFGCQVSEVGAGYTWSQNSREYKLTPWSNDPILDPAGEALYLRDEETGRCWTVTANPLREQGSYTIRHGQGYSIFEHSSRGLKQTLRLFVPMDKPVKILELSIENLTSSLSRLNVLYYVEWVMGVVREQTAPYLVTEYDQERNAFFVRNTYQDEYAGRVGFIAALGERVRSYTGDRTEFIGRNGNLEDPAGLTLDSFSGIDGAGLDPCSALQLDLSISPGETKTLTLLLGEAPNRQEAEEIITLYEQPEKVGEAYAAVVQHWEKLLSAVSVKTPDLAMNLLLNRWLLYQTIVCRLWARSAFYQSGGAYGFRDQLQDVMALVYSDPQVARQQILIHCRHQFVDGDVQHWWHAERGKGIRTRFSDDLLWLPFVTSHYIDRSGDTGILDEMTLFLEDEPLGENEDERYSIPRISGEQASVYEHCVRAIERGLQFGEHGLPLIGSGDWNDGFSRIGHKGKGESVWLGWFIYLTLTRFAELCDSQGDGERGVRYRRVADELKQTMEAYAWDGGWYRRAYFDDGTPLGSSQNDECQIDALAQSWSVLSGAARPSRAQDAMLALEHYLWRKEDGLLLLLTPPFDKQLPDPGYIKGYVPGVRENGGQYTHGAIWAILAYTTLGEGDKAAELFQMLNPINHARTEHEVSRYKVEPYVMAADVYATPSHVGRGGWTWYTGAAGWMYQAGLEGILGFKRQGDTLTLNPCIPGRWPGFSLTYRFQSSRYEIEVKNPAGKMSGCSKITLDDKELPEPVIALKDDGLTHQVCLIL